MVLGRDRREQDPIFILKQTSERVIMEDGELHIYFVDLEKVLEILE